MRHIIQGLVSPIKSKKKKKNHPIIMLVWANVYDFSIEILTINLSNFSEIFVLFNVVQILDYIKLYLTSRKSTTCIEQTMIEAVKIRYISMNIIINIHPSSEKKFFFSEVHRTYRKYSNLLLGNSPYSSDVR